MNTLLQKCVNELRKEMPKLDYIVGILETLIEVNSVPKDSFLVADGQGKVRVTTHEKEIRQAIAQETPKDEGAFLDSMAAANVAKLKAEAERMQREG